MSKYFGRFPLVNYDGTPAKNIMMRLDFTDKTKKDIYSNFDFVLDDSTSRQDILSYNYYGSSRYDWLIHLSNNVIDPYYDWFMTDDQFNKFIEKKYGSISNAKATIVFYRNDWSIDESVISPSVYDQLDIEIQKYWKPKTNNAGGIIGYERVREDWIATTNMILSLEVTNIGDYAVGDRIYQTSTDSYATVVKVDTANNTLTIQHVDGSFAVNESEGITSVTLISQNIPSTEISFWGAVSAYDDLKEKNELKKYINMIKKSYLQDLEKQFVEQVNR